MSSRKPLPPPPRPSLKRSLTSMMSTLTRKPSRTPRRVSSWDPTWQSQPAPRRVRIAPEPHPWASRPPRFDIVESGGLALADAQDAFTDSRRAVWTRIVWSLPVEHDVGARGLMDRVGERDVAEGLAKLGVKRYLEDGKGAIFCNAGFDSGSSRRIAVDWVTFRDTQKTRDKLLQQEVLRNDPATSVLVYVFRLAPDNKSLAIWRRKIPLPVSVAGPNSAAIAAQKRRLADQEQMHVIKISPPKEELSRGASLRRWASLSRRASMCAVDTNWGFTLDEYLESRKFAPRPLPPLQQVRDSIHALLGDTSPMRLLKMKPITSSTLEDLLSLAYRPKHLYLLNEPLIPACYRLMKTYIKDIGLFGRVDGYLCLNVLALTMMVGVLSHTGQLDTFTERASQLSEGDTTDVSPLLVTRISKMMEYVMNDSNSSQNGLSRVFDWNIELDTKERICLPGIGSFRFEHAEFLLKHFTKERKRFLEVIRKAPTPGWSLLMSVIWGQVSVVPPTPAVKPQWLQLRDTSFRYLLAAGTDEDLFFPSLCGDVHLRFRNEFHQPGEDADDTERIVDMFVKKMKLPPGVPNSRELPLVFLSTVSNWVAASIIKHKTRRLLPAFFSAFAERVWADLGSTEPMDVDRWVEIPPYVFDLVRNLQGLFLGKFGQDDPATSIPMFASVLRDINFIDLMGRMLLMPMSNQAPAKGLWSTNKLRSQWEDDWVTMSFFSHTLSNFNPSSRATLIDLYQPWANTWFQLTMNKSRISARDPLRLFIMHCEKVWLELGDALRFLTLRDELWVGCANPRCYSPMNDGGAQWMCVKCLKAAYCSARCQNVHWKSKYGAHKLVCGHMG